MSSVLAPSTSAMARRGSRYLSSGTSQNRLAPQSTHLLTVTVRARASVMDRVRDRARVRARAGVGVGAAVDARHRVRVVEPILLLAHAAQRALVPRRTVAAAGLVNALRAAHARAA